MDRRGRSHPHQCTTSREDRQIGRTSVADYSVTSRTVAQHIESVTHHSETARTIRRHLQQSGLSVRRPLLSLPLTQSHRRHLHRQWCDKRRMPWPQPYFNRIMRDHTWHALSKGFSSITRLNCFPGRLALQIFRRYKTCGPWLLNDWPRLYPQLPHQINFGNVFKLLGLLYPKNTSKVSLNQCRVVWQW
ncbi:transposable element Tcb1 transposase [Trichonephila clavipes]|nr:transposable element Tcb1 transposase [Trichonephila clavipes]